MTQPHQPLLVVARYVQDPTKFTASVTMEELLDFLNLEVLPVRDVYYQAVDGDSVTLQRIGSLRVEFTSDEALQAEHTPPSDNEPQALNEAPGHDENEETLDEPEDSLLEDPPPPEEKQPPLSANPSLLKRVLG